MLNLLGKYFPRNSFWHTLDPRSKWVVFVAILLPLFWVNFKGLLILAGIVAALYIGAKIPLKMGGFVVGKFKWLLMIILLANLGGWGGPKIFSNLAASVLIVLKVMVSLLVAAWLSFVTKPQSLTEGLTKGLRPFSRGVDWPFFIGLVIRFIPEIEERASEIIAAQRLRGAMPGRLWYRNRQWFKSTMIPIFLAALRSSTALAIAMESRGYRYGQFRTPWEELRFRPRDWMITTSAVLGLAIFIYFKSKW